MTTYRLQDADTLLVSVDDGAWQTIVFQAADFEDAGAATAEEVAKGVRASGILEAWVDAEGNLALATPSRGGHTSIAIDAARSTAAGALGLLPGAERASGSGLQAARLVSTAAEPFPLPHGAEMTVVVDGKRSRITFDHRITAKKATADEVAQVIGAKAKGAARASRDGRVILTSPSHGPGSTVEVLPGRVEQDKVDAAAILGFTGAAALSRPHTAEPAVLRCAPAPSRLTATNLTDGPIELHFPTGAAVLPARSTVPLPPGAAAHGPLQRLVAQGALRLE